MSVRAVLAALALAFAVYQAARGLLWVIWPANPGLLLAAVVIYLVATALTIFAVPHPRDPEAPREPMPLWAAIVAAGAAPCHPILPGVAGRRAWVEAPPPKRRRAPRRGRTWPGSRTRGRGRRPRAGRRS